MFNKFVEMLLENHVPEDCLFDQSLIDSMPIITCSGKRQGKVAKGLTDKGFCSTKGMYYYGMKMHTLGFRRPGTLPNPEQLLFTPASVNDISVYKQAWSHIVNRTFFGDKIYMDSELNQDIMKTLNSVMMTPVKAVKGMADVIKQRIKAAEDLYSTAVSRIRQPIESLFNWLIQKTDIQKASFVRATSGLLVHVFGKLAAAFIKLAF